MEVDAPNISIKTKTKQYKLNMTLLIPDILVNIFMPVFFAVQTWLYVLYGVKLLLFEHVALNFVG